VSSKADLDQRVGRLWDSHWDVIAKSGANKKILLVEGDDDKRIVEELLRYKSAEWATSVYVGVAGSREKVLDKLKKHPSWYGLVDRDIWEAVDENRHDRLTVTEGWCIESHFCVPEVLAAAVGKQERALREKLDPLVPGWLRYGAIWWAFQRKRKELVATLADGTCGHPTSDACPDAATLRARLAQYAAVLPSVEVERIVEAVEARAKSIQALPSERAQIEQGIHGKRFFAEVVVDDVLKILVKQRSATQWRVKIAEALQSNWPAYLQNLADRLLER